MANKFQKLKAMVTDKVKLKLLVFILGALISGVTIGHSMTVYHRVPAEICWAVLCSLRPEWMCKPCVEDEGLACPHTDLYGQYR